ncbi:MAG: primosomal protein N' [Syntrophobacteria bacterium]
MNGLFVEVAVVLPVTGTYHYRVPPELAGEVAVGRQVLVPFGNRRLTGYILSVDGQPPSDMEPAIRDILQVSSEEACFTEAHLPFYRWLSSYYLAPLGKVIQSTVPKGTCSTFRRGASVSDSGRYALREPRMSTGETSVLSLLLEHPGLNRDQIRRYLPKHAVDRICRALARKGLIVWQDQVHMPSVKPRHLKMVEPVCDAAAAARAGDQLKPKEKEILALLAEGPRLARDLQCQVKNAYEWVQKMSSKGLVCVKDEEVYRDPGGQPVIRTSSPHALTVHQERAVQAVCQAMQSGSFACFLLYGVTGSGKTEVYLASVAAAMRLGKQSLVLVPEIALTAQLEAAFRQRFHSRVAILHSGLGLGERRDEWTRVLRGEVDVVVGVRSAVFAPLSRLGLVVVDEEHDASYKQETGLRYHGRDAAIMRAKLKGAVVLMGSATPALSTYNNALQGKFQLLSLPDRIDRRPLPRVAVVDMRLQRRGEVISLPLRQALKDCLAAGKQALLLINRRGYANFLLCRSCGHVLRCRNCAVSLTWHQTDEKLRCHLCGLAMNVPPACPRCEATALRRFGFGTQRVEREVQRLLPQARVRRMDRDTTRSKQSYRQFLRDLGHGRTDILVGTQMIAKGHDFPNITLVGVVSADIALQWPDFRAGENTFQILTQVAGRAGRGETPGTVLVQTYNPEHYSIRFAKEHDYLGFFEKEMTFRKELGYPPYRRLILFQVAGNVEEKTEEAARRLAARFQELRRTDPGRCQELEVLGPVAAPLARIKGKYRWHMVLKAERSSLLLYIGGQLVNWGQAALKGTGVTLSADVDPQSMI